MSADPAGAAIPIEKGGSVRRGDLVWLVMFLAASAALAWPVSEDWLWRMAGRHRYLTGFLAFGLLGPLGEALAERFRRRQYPRPGALAVSALGWGVTGLALALLFWVANGGVVLAQASGLLPGGGYGFSPNPLRAFLTSFFFTGPFFTSLILNAGPLFFLAVLRRLAETARQLAAEGTWPGPGRICGRADWAGFIREEALIQPLFRLPLLTVVFMLPPELWLVLAAWLGAILTGLLGLAAPRGTGRNSA